MLVITSDTSAVPYSSEVVNLILHVSVYDLDPSNFSPSLELISEVLKVLPQLGLSIDYPLAPGKPLNQIITTYSHSKPLETFAMLASYDCEAFATELSVSCLSTPLYLLTDELCQSMGPGEPSFCFSLPRDHQPFLTPSPSQYTFVDWSSYTLVA